VKRPKLDSIPILFVAIFAGSQGAVWIVRALRHGECLSNGATAAVGGVGVTVVLVTMMYLERWLVRRKTRLRQISPERQ
jgi:hypothetical protein